MIGALIPALEGLGVAFEELGAAEIARELVPPIRVNVTSSAIASVTYYEASGDMVVNMRDGTAVEYSGIPVSVFLALVSAPSPGTFYNQNIRGRF